VARGLNQWVAELWMQLAVASGLRWLQQLGLIDLLAISTIRARRSPQPLGLDS
jgi:hypothetical protein